MNCFMEIARSRNFMKIQLSLIKLKLLKDVIQNFIASWLWIAYKNVNERQSSPVIVSDSQCLIYHILMWIA